MDKYIYLLLSLSLLLIWATIFFVRKDLRKKMLTVSFMGALAGPISEFRHFCWGCLGGIGYEFTFGYKKIPHLLSKNSF